MFWTEDLNQLLKPVLIPTDHMSIDDKLNALTRLIIFVCIILALVLQDSKIIVLMFFLIILVIVLQKYQKSFDKDLETFFNEKKLATVDNSICIKPTKDNPYMNPSVFELNEENFKACSINDGKINELIDKYFDDTMFINVDDIYNKTNSKRQFYTVPNTTIPNDQAIFANWLYNRGKSCKEGNGDTCYNNLYRDLRLI